MSCSTAIKDNCNYNYIKETVAKIDKLQKDVVSDTELTCISCETSLFTSVNNTIPVKFFTCCGTTITGQLGASGASTSFFRIEAIRCSRFVTLRLLDETATTASNYTMIIDLDCVGGIQCFEPITVEICTSSTNL